MPLESSLSSFDETDIRSPVVGMRVDVADHHSEVPFHQHRQGQLVLALRGGVTCEVPHSIWMAPPLCAVWIPGQMPHSIRATANARICYLFVQPDAAALPKQCCTLGISALVRELILDLADQHPVYDADSATGRKAVVLLEELVQMPVERLHLPTSSDARLRKIAKMLTSHPSDRRPLQEWGKQVAMSERSLARLIQQETGLTFGRWRQQLHLIIAMRQLAAGQSVQRVAEELGYGSVTAFITMFKKVIGKPPARYFTELGRSNEP